MKIFFALTMLASAFADKPDFAERVERHGDRQLDGHERELNGCYCYTPFLEIWNDGFSEDSGTPDPSVFIANDDGNQARRISDGVSTFGGSWFLRGYPQGSKGDEAVLPGVLYSLPSSYGSFPEYVYVAIKVAATNTWRNNNCRAVLEYRLLNCPTSVCTLTSWATVLNFDDKTCGGEPCTNTPPRDGSDDDLDDDGGFFYSDWLDLTSGSSSGCYNYDNEKIEFRIRNTKQANDGNQNNRNFFVRQFELYAENCKSGY